MRPSSWLSALAGALVLTGAGGIASVAFSFALPLPALAALLALGGGLGFAVAEGAGALVWLWDASAIREHTYAKADLMRADADAKRAALDRHAAPPYGREEPPGAREDEPLADPKLQAKSVAIETFLRAGEKAGGFSEGKLAGCVGSDHGPWLRHFYISPAGGEWLRDAGGKTGTVWNYERTLDAALRELRAGVFPLPPGPVPDVHPLPDSAAQRRASQKGEKRTITGVRAD